MKRKIFFWLTVFALTSGVTQTWAAATIDELHIATKAACDEFQRTHADHVSHFTGYKSWISGDDLKVKVYVNHDGMNMDYSYVCQKHDSAIHCFEQ